MNRFILSLSVSGVIFAVLCVFRILGTDFSPEILALVGALLFLAGAFFLKLFEPRTPFNRFFRWKGMNFLEWRIALCFSVLLIFGSVLINALTDVLLRALSLGAGGADGLGYRSVWMALLCSALIPALTEELYFRGAVQTTFETAKMKTWAAVFFDAFLFALMHGNFRYFLSNFYAGVLLALLVLLTGSLYASVTAHLISNAVSCFLGIYGARLSASGIGNLAIHISVVCLLGALCHLLFLMKKLLLRRDAEDRSAINENSRRWEERKKRGLSDEKAE